MCEADRALQTVPLLLFPVGFSSPVLATVSGVVTFKNPNEPLHGHLALTHNISEMMYVHELGIGIFYPLIT